MGLGFGGSGSRVSKARPAGIYEITRGKGPYRQVLWRNIRMRNFAKPKV